ncbi:MAG TPA: maleylpyruvate isomerase family mycothiol-dependent enzyme [Acidimicrobiales bacterium]|nr:maleylpyruvate isomerase family mycothiol-dependent enzyme [Acidimicrobiales bacterium]
MDALGALAAQQAELAALVDGLDEAAWRRPSACPGWTVADVVLHLAQTNEMAIGSATGRFDEALADLTAGLGPAASVDEGAELMVARDRTVPAAAIFDRWRSSVARLRDALAAHDPGDRVQWVAGELSVQTLATTRLAETWIHTGDVAGGLGRPLPPTDRLRLIARLAWRTLPYAFTREGRELAGPVGFELTGPAGDTWAFGMDVDPQTVIRGDALELCLVAGRRVEGSSTALRGEGPDAGAVLALVRTYA